MEGFHLFDHPFNIILLTFQNSAKNHFYFFSHGMQNSIEILFETFLSDNAFFFYVIYNI